MNLKPYLGIVKTQQAELKLPCKNIMLNKIIKNYILELQRKDIPRNQGKRKLLPLWSRLQVSDLE